MCMTSIGFGHKRCPTLKISSLAMHIRSPLVSHVEDEPSHLTSGVLFDNIAKMNHNISESGLT